LCRVPRAPKPLESRLGERSNLSSELGRHGIFYGHVRAVTASRPEALAPQESLGGHAVSVVGGSVGAIDIAIFQGGDGRGGQPERRSVDLGIGQCGEIAGLEALQPTTIDQVHDCLFALEPARHNLFPPSPLEHERQAAPLTYSPRYVTAPAPPAPPAAPASPERLALLASSRLCRPAPPRVPRSSQAGWSR